MITCNYKHFNILITIWNMTQTRITTSSTPSIITATTLMNDITITIIHINSRSLYADFTGVKDYLKRFTQSFNVTEISETWKKGWTLIWRVTSLCIWIVKIKGGIGVAIYVDKNINFRVLDRISTVVDNMLECISIEMYKEKNKSVIISFIYRTPAS